MGLACQLAPHPVHCRSPTDTRHMATINANLSLADERILYEAIWRHVDHLAQQDWASSDAILAAKLAQVMFPELGYPVPGWVAELAAMPG